MSAKTIIRLDKNPPGFGQQPDELEPEMFTSELPAQHTHSVYEDDELGIYIGLWDTCDMTEAPGPYTCDEFMWLLEGQAEIRNSKTGQAQTAKAGEAFIIPRGYDCQWHQSGYLRKFYVISEHPEEGIPAMPAVEGIVKPALSATKTGQASLHSAMLNIDKSIQKEDICYLDNCGRFYAGTWESEPFYAGRQIMPHNEFVYVQQGTLILEDEAGKTHHFCPSDAFFIPQGTVCRWQASENIRLFYALIKAH